MDIHSDECCFEVTATHPGIKSIIVNKDALGFKIDIHGTNEGDRSEGGDTMQDDVGSVIRILSKYVRSDSAWVDYSTRETVHVWDALVALSQRE
jgi:hypothetical protein